MNESEDEEIIEIYKDELKPLEECSHEPGYLPGSDFSEWAVNSALLRLGDTCTNKELGEALRLAATDEALIELGNMGLIDSFWDEKSGQMVFQISKQGHEYVNSLKVSGT